MPAPATTTAELASQASYDAEDARPVATDAGDNASALLDTVDESWRESARSTVESPMTATATNVESVSSESPASARADESRSVVGEPVLADDRSPLVGEVAPLAADEAPGGVDREALSTLSSLDTFEPTMPAVGPVPTTGDTETRSEARAAEAELASDEQFEVAEGDPRESSEGAERTT